MLPQNKDINMENLNEMLLEGFWERYLEYCLVWTILLVALVVVYFLVSRVFLKKYNSFATYGLSSLLGITAGVGMGAMLDGVVFTALEGYSKHPIAVPLNRAVMLVCFVLFWCLFYVYCKQRAKIKSVGGTITDVAYAILLIIPCSINYSHFYSFCSIIYHFLEK